MKNRFPDSSGDFFKDVSRFLGWLMKFLKGRGSSARGRRFIDWLRNELKR